MNEFYKNKKVVVTGGCGFIGSHIAHKLVGLGAQVTILDNLATGSLDNIENIKDNVTFIEQSIVDYDACDNAISGNEIIFHLAAFISVPGSVQDPQAATKPTWTAHSIFFMLQKNMKSNVWYSHQPHRCTAHGKINAKKPTRT